MIEAVVYLLALIIVGVALLALLIVIRILWESVRRFRTELAGYRAWLDTEAGVLQAGREELRGRLDRGRASWGSGRLDEYYQ